MRSSSEGVAYRVGADRSVVDLRNPCMTSAGRKLCISSLDSSDFGTAICPVLCRCSSCSPVDSAEILGVPQVIEAKVSCTDCRPGSSRSNIPVPPMTVSIVPESRVASFWAASCMTAWRPCCPRAWCSAPGGCVTILCNSCKAQLIFSMAKPASLCTLLSSSSLNTTNARSAFNAAVVIVLHSIALSRISMQLLKACCPMVQSISAACCL
jgi:hypothetical protein